MLTENIFLYTAVMCIFTVTLIGDDISTVKSIGRLPKESVKARELLEEEKISQSISYLEFLETADRETRLDFFAAIWSDSINSTEPQVQKELVNHLILGLDDEYAGSWILDRIKLPPFSSDYFSEEARIYIKNYSPKRGQLTNYLLLSGVAEVDPVNIDVRELSQKETLFENERANALFQSMSIDNTIRDNSSSWASHLFFARNGDKASISGILDYIESIDRIHLVGRSKLIEDLGYICQPQAIDLLVDLLFSNIPSDDQQPKGSDYYYTPLSHWAVKGLAYSLIDFPIDYWDPVTSENLEKAREFISNYEGPWKIKGKWEPEEEPLKETETKFTKEESVQDITPSPESEESSKQSDEEANNRIPWLPVILILLAAIGIILRFRKNAS